MARRNLLRSLLAASLMVVPSVVGVLVPSPAGAISDPDHRVTVDDTHFSPDVVYAMPSQTVQFDLAPGASTHHTVTLENGICADRPMRLCEETFDDPENPPVFRFSDYGEYPYYDRYAREAGNNEMQGVIIITDQLPATTTTTTVPPTTSSTMASTTTTRPVTTTTTRPATTTTTAPATIHPFLIPGPAPTTTTTARPAGTTTTASKKNGGGSASSAGDKGKGDKGKAASTDAPATAEAAPEGSPIEVTFDPATLTPLPGSAAATAAEDTTLDSGPEESAMLDLLSETKEADNGTRLLIIALGLLGVLVVLTCSIAWFRRSSRYFPA